MKFSTIVALVGTASAIKHGASINYGCPPPQPVCEQSFCAGPGAGANGESLPYPAYSGSLSAQVSQPGEGGSDGFAKLSSEASENQSSISASQITIPDKNFVTDQAKVHESVAKGDRKSQTCQVARRKFSINGEITVDEKYNDNLKGEETQKKCGQGASQTRSRTQLLNRCTGGGAQASQTRALVCQNAQPCGPCNSC